MKFNTDSNSHAQWTLGAHVSQTRLHSPEKAVLRETKDPHAPPRWDTGT